MYSNWCHEPMPSIYAMWKPSNFNGIYFYFMDTPNVMLNCIQSVYIRKGSYQLTRYSQQQLTGHNVTCSELAVCIRWPKYWSFSFSISLSNEYSGFISFRIDWFDLLTVQESSLALQLESIKSSALFFMVQLSHPYMTTGKTIALMDLWAFVGKVVSLLLIYYIGLSIAFLQEAIILFHGCSHNPQ